MLQIISKPYAVILALLLVMPGCNGNRENSGNTQAKEESPAEQGINIQKKTPEKTKAPGKEEASASTKKNRRNKSDFY